MKPISTFAHGIMDYLGGILLIAAPNLLGFSDVGGAAVMVPCVIGVVVLLQSLITDYELGVAGIIPMKMHIMNDYIASVFLLASPWLFGFNSLPPRAWTPHVVVGFAVLVVILFTSHIPNTSQKHHAYRV